MKAVPHFLRYLAKFFLEWEMFLTNVVEKIKTHILCSTPFFRKSHRLWDNVEKYSGDREATNDVTIWRIRVACRISKATRTYAHAHVHSPGTHMHARRHKHARTDQYVTLIAFPQQQWFRERYVIRTLPVLFWCWKLVTVMVETKFLRLFNIWKWGIFGRESCNLFLSNTMFLYHYVVTSSASSSIFRSAEHLLVHVMCSISNHRHFFHPSSLP
jgi:hypothetical protein